MRRFSRERMVPAPTASTARTLAAAALAGGVFLHSHTVLAADHTNLEDGLPVEVADARATGYLNREAQARFRFERTHDDKNIFLLEPRFEFGFPRNAQLSVKLPFVLASGTGFDIGRGQLEALYNLNQQTLTVPSLSLGAAVDAPGADSASGNHADGFDPLVKAYLTKSIPTGSFYHQVHFNGVYQFNNQRDASRERHGRYRAIVGYSFRISPSAIGVVDFVREQQMDKRVEDNVAEFGVRYLLTPLLVIAAGGGFGIGDESPAARGTVAVQYRPFLPR